MAGYSVALVEANKAADGKRLGVKLGRFCIKKNIPISTVARMLSMSRHGVYKWFLGKCDPRASKHEAIERFMGRYSD